MPEHSVAQLLQMAVSLEGVLQLRLLLMAAKILKSVEVVAAGGQPYQDLSVVFLSCSFIHNKSGHIFQ
jgi:hypothetical protein